jgi:Spy/CpxP family protein refolding chaperone
MRKLFGLMVVGGLIAFVASDSNAQRPGGFGGFGGGGGLTLLANKGVQEELKITDEQKEKITAAAKEFGFGGGGFKKDQTKEDREKARKEREEKTKKFIADTLKPEQAKRLKEIERQQNPATTLTTDEDVMKAVALTDDQKAKIKGLIEDNAKEMPKFGGKDTNFKEMQEKITALRKELKEKTLKVLTEDQTKKWTELTGAAFEVKFEGFGGGIRKKKDD